MATIQTQKTWRATVRTAVAGAMLAATGLLGWLAYGGVSTDADLATPRSFDELLEELKAAEIAAADCRTLDEVVPRCVP